jgi:hypothetical protein
VERRSLQHCAHGIENEGGQNNQSQLSRGNIIVGREPGAQTAQQSRKGTQQKETGKKHEQVH